MNCKKCGATLLEGSQICKNCGAVVTEDSSIDKLNKQDINSSSNYSNLNNSSITENQNYLQPWANGFNNKEVKKDNMWSFKFLKDPKYIIVALISFVILLIMFILSIVIICNVVDNRIKSQCNTVSEKQSYYSINFSGFNFKIPEELIYKLQDESLILSDENENWQAVIKIQSNKYSELLKNMSELQSELEKSGYNASKPMEKEIGGIQFIVVEVSKDKTNLITSYVKANPMYSMNIIALDKNDKIDYSILEKIVPVINNLTFIGETNNG